MPHSMPNLTNMHLRRKMGNVHMRQYQVDPHWGIPPGTPPLAFDPTTGFVRPFSSYGTLTTAAANFIGFASDTFAPGENHSVWVELAGWVEFKLLTPVAVVAGDLFMPTLVNADIDFVSNDTVEPSTEGNPLAIFTAVKSCLCEPFYEGPTVCGPSPPAAADVSPTVALNRRLQRTVTCSFGVVIR